MSRRKPQPTQAAQAAEAFRARHRAEYVAALRDGRRQVAHRMPNGRAEANRRACRGRFD